MKKVIILLLAIMVWSPSLKALVCVEGSCANMGYTTPVTETIENCKRYIKCPYDTNYHTCAEYDAYPLSECPDGADCAQSPRWKFSKCKDKKNIYDNNFFYTYTAGSNYCFLNRSE